MKRTSRTQKYILFFLKICTFWKNGDFVKKYFGKKLIFILAISTVLKAALDAQPNIMPTRYCFFFISVRSKVIVFFVKNLPKLNILSVIAIDRVKVFK